jgi:hypothetical protein
MPKTLVDLLAGAALRWRLNSRVRHKPAPPPAARPRRRPSPISQKQPEPRSPSMNLSFLAGYRTYVIAVAMLLAGAAQLVGVDIPSFDGQSAGHLLMEGLAILFLRKGLKAG